MERLNSMLIGFVQIIEKPTVYLHLMEFFLIMKVHYVVNFFVTQKICNAVAKIKFGIQNKIQLGNLDANVIGGMLKNMLKVCGEFFSTINLMISYWQLVEQKQF